MKTNITSIEELTQYLNANLSIYFNASYADGKITFENEVFEIDIAEA